MFDRILIANRGEIALRVIRACQELGIKTTVVFSEADRGAHYLTLADEAVCIGPEPARDSYLDVSRIMSVAEIADCDAIHPGYGFLSENSQFAEICRQHSITFIGPTPEAINLCGNKSAARNLAVENDVPIVPGSKGVVTEESQAIEIAARIGYPVMIKASAGGGGRGMRVAHNQAALISGFHQARSEAGAAFKDDSIYIEKFVVNPRHIEIQIVADEHGNIIHLGERDCTLQRRHQKLVEEAPSPVMTAELREEMGEAAIRLARGANYTNVGTVEFLVDQEMNFYFMEMNSRIQVEHPVTEEVTGIDLIKQQIRIANGEELTIRQEDVRFIGHAIECRINAEDPHRNFRPCPGTIGTFYAPGGRGVRFDSHIHAGYRVGIYYDSLVGKLIVHGRHRDEAIRMMARALSEIVTENVCTTVPLLRDLMADSRFRSADIHTHYVEQKLAEQR
jgi:acetyl-CoA carboxylase biotin carboxylase subunit